MAFSSRQERPHICLRPDWAKGKETWALGERQSESRNVVSVPEFEFQVRVDLCLPNLDILLADSSAYWRRSVRDMLRRAGATRCREACDGAEALGAIEEKAPDLLVLDWRLPVVGAGEIMRMLRLSGGASQQPAVPIIVTISDPMRAEIDEVLALGANEILAKPFSTSALLARFGETVRRPRDLVEVGGRWRPAPRLPLAA